MGPEPGQEQVAHGVIVTSYYDVAGRKFAGSREAYFTADPVICLGSSDEGLLHVCDSAATQTKKMKHDPLVTGYLPEFEGRGKTVDQYMVAAYYWLGWGIKGYRQQYAYEYSKKLVLA